MLNVAPKNLFEETVVARFGSPKNYIRIRAGIVRELIFFDKANENEALVKAKARSDFLAKSTTFGVHVSAWHGAVGLPGWVERIQ